MNWLTKSLAILILILSTASAQAKKSHDTSTSASDLEQLSTSTSLSQLIRSNTKHYWNWIRARVQDDDSIQKWLSYEGIIMGDPHLGNFGPSLVLSKKTNSPELKYVVIDFDDMGRGPFILDLARFVVATEAITSKVKKQDIVDAYVEGLADPDADLSGAPSQIQKALDTDVSDYYSQLEDKVDKDTKGDVFKLKDGELEAYDGPVQKSDVEKILGDVKVLDLAKKIIDRGGSKDSIRLWALVEFTEGGRRSIIELKEWQEPGLAQYEDQPSFASVLKQGYDVFWPGLATSSYELTTVAGTQFWVREKKLSMVDIPYSVNKDSEEKFIEDDAVYTARALGQIHGRQAAGQEFLKAIQNSKNGNRDLKEAIEPYIREYLDFVQEEFENH